MTAFVGDVALALFILFLLAGGVRLLRRAAGKRHREQRRFMRRRRARRDAWRELWRAAR